MRFIPPTIACSCVIIVRTEPTRRCRRTAIEKGVIAQKTETQYEEADNTETEQHTKGPMGPINTARTEQAHPQPHVFEMALAPRRFSYFHSIFLWLPM